MSRKGYTEHPVAKYAKPVRYTGQTPTTCGVPDCGRPHHATNLCTNHYSVYTQWLRKYGQPTPAAHIQPLNTTPCSVPGCHRNYKRHGLCHAHYMRVWRKAQKDKH